MSVMKIKAAGIPAGRYHVTFEEAEESFHEEWGEGLFWKFRVYQGEFSGKDTGRTTTPDPTPGNACGRMLAGLADMAPSEGLNLDPDDFIGRKYVIDVALSKNGKGTRVERIVRPVDSDETKTANDNQLTENQSKSDQLADQIVQKNDTVEGMDAQAEELF